MDEVEGAELRVRLGQFVLLYERLVATNSIEAFQHEDDGPEDHQDCLDEVGPDDGGEAAAYGEDGGYSQQRQDGEVEPLLPLQVHGEFDKERPGVQVSLEKSNKLFDCFGNVGWTQVDLQISW